LIPVAVWIAVFSERIPGSPSENASFNLNPQVVKSEKTDVIADVKAIAFLFFKDLVSISVNG
jgi:hypothetical protein